MARLMVCSARAKSIYGTEHEDQSASYFLKYVHQSDLKGCMDDPSAGSEVLTLNHETQSHSVRNLSIDKQEILAGCTKLATALVNSVINRGRRSTE